MNPMIILSQNRPLAKVTPKVQSRKNQRTGWVSFCLLCLEIGAFKFKNF